MTREKLDRSAIVEGLGGLDGWSLADDGLSIGRRFSFGNFIEAFGFMARCALAAEKMDHHPEWSNVYKHVEVRLTTHSAKGVTKLDLDLAREMNRFAGQ